MSLTVARVRGDAGQESPAPVTCTVAGRLFAEPEPFEHVSDSTYVPGDEAVTLRGDVADVVSVHPASEGSALPFNVAEPAHDVAPVTVQLTANADPTPALAGAVSANGLGVGPPPPPPRPQPAPVSVAPVATRSVPPEARRKPFASVVMSQVVFCEVVTWIVTCAPAVPETTRATAETSEAKRRIATVMEFPA